MSDESEPKLIKINDYLESKGKLFNIVASKSGFKIRLVFDQVHESITFDEDNFKILVSWARERMGWKL